MSCENGSDHHDGTGSDFGCKVKTIQISPAATPNRRNTNPPRVEPMNSWERGVPTDSRGMPFLGPDLAPIGQKKYAEQRHRIEDKRRELAQSPAVPSAVKTSTTT